MICCHDKKERLGFALSLFLYAMIALLYIFPLLIIYVYLSSLGIG